MSAVNRVHPPPAAERAVVDRTEKEIASAIEELIEAYPPAAHAAILHAARIALGNAPERWKVAA